MATHGHRFQPRSRVTSFTARSKPSFSPWSEPGVPRPDRPRPWPVLRDLGGYSAVAQRQLEGRLSRFDGNPRIDAGRRQQLARAFSGWIPSAREQIQTYLNRMELTGNAAPTVSPSTRAPGSASRRIPAGQGDHPEQELVAADLRLMGRVDLLKVAPEGATITDFKTGAEDTTHHEQLRLYALLWHADTAANPKALPVTSLVAAYPSHEVVVSTPDAVELVQMASEIQVRVTAADAAVASDSPDAVVGEQCGSCSVRALCDAYWKSGAPRTAEMVDGAWFDLDRSYVGFLPGIVEFPGRKLSFCLRM